MFSKYLALLVCKVVSVKTVSGNWKPFKHNEFFDFSLFNSSEKLFLENVYADFFGHWENSLIRKLR